MDVRTPYPYWLLQQGIMGIYPSLKTDVHTDVAILGAGISGALTAWYLNQQGIDTIILDKRHAGMGSTAASTALLQYEIDVPLTELVLKVGYEAAVTSYQLCMESIETLAAICKKTGVKSFDYKPSFQYASYKKDITSLQQEYQLRKQIGIDLNYLDSQEIENKFGFTKEAGLLSAAGAQADAYEITHALLKTAQSNGLQVYDNTEVKDITHHPKHITLTTADGLVIKAKKLVIAAGYESLKYIPKKIATLHTTYAIVSEPFEQSHFWYKNALIWETADPYLYMRTTPDHRILIGGKDVGFTNVNKRKDSLPAKTKALEHSFQQLLPHLPFKTDFEWAGTFATTKDGLPYIGTLPGLNNTYFALGFGGNGITFSVIAAEIITDLLTGKSNKQAKLFSFNR